MLCCDANGDTTHINPVEYIKSVPNRRETLAAFDKIVAELRSRDSALVAEIELVADFLKSR